MNRNQASGFETPFNVPEANNSSAMSFEIPSGQKSPKYSDSPNRDITDSDQDYLDLFESVNVQSVLEEIDTKFKERMKTVTVKESLLFFKDKDRTPGFLGINIRFNPSHGSEEVAKRFEMELEETRKALTKTFFDRMEAVCNDIIYEHMQSAHNILIQAVNKLDTTDPESAKFRTELYSKFEEMKTKYKHERAKYAAKLRAKKEKTETTSTSNLPRYFTKEGRKKMSLKKRKLDN